MSEIETEQESTRRHEMDMWADSKNKQARIDRDDDQAGRIEAEQRRW